MKNKITGFMISLVIAISLLTIIAPQAGANIAHGEATAGDLSTEARSIGAIAVMVGAEYFIGKR